MALVEFPTFEYHPRLPRRQQLDPRQLLFTYDATADSLLIYFYGEPRAAVNVPSGDEDDLVSLRVDSTTEDVIGIEIEDFLAVAVPAQSLWREMAKLSGIQSTEVKDVPPHVLPERKAVAALSLLGDLIPALR